MKYRPLFALAVALIPIALLFAATSPRQQDVASLTAEIKKGGEEADPALIQQLGNLRTRDAMASLTELYDKTFSSVYMKREVVKALGQFDGVADAEQPAYQKLTDIASTSTEPELRSMALDVLGQSKNLGKHFLKTIVNSAAVDDIRERAMEKICRMATAEDKDFFEALCKDPDAAKKDEKDKEKKAKKDKAKEGEGEKRINQLKSIREMAFEQLAPGLDAARLAEAARDRDPDDGRDWEMKAGLRRLALLELEKRGDKKLADVAKAVYEDKQERPGNRAEAARILAQADNKIIAKFIDDGCEAEAVTPEELRDVLADLSAKYRDAEAEKKLVKLLGGKGKPPTLRFALRALRGYKDDKLSKSIAKDVVAATKKAPEPDKAEYHDQRDIVLGQLELLASMGDKGVLPDLQTVIDKCGDETIVAAAMDASGALRGNDADWLKVLETSAASPKLEVRNAALIQLGKTKDAKYAAVLSKALDDANWSTRAAALTGLEAMRTPAAIGAIVARMDKESGLLLSRFAETLFRLTGKPFRTSPSAWKSWWEKEGSSFQPITAVELSKLQAAEETRRLKETTKTAQFFGIRIVSHRVIFIIDISGSMNEPTKGEYVGKAGKTRIEVAKEELIKCIDALDKDSLFNIVIFSSDAEPWLKGGIAAYSKSNKEEAKAYVSKLGANGGTNLYGSLKMAFADPDVDTIFVLSDGEPSVGDETDQAIIRARVKEWNLHRGILINTIQVGGSFQILQWLADDTGGMSKKFQ